MPFKVFLSNVFPYFKKRIYAVNKKEETDLVIFHTEIVIMYFSQFKLRIHFATLEITFLIPASTCMYFRV